MLYEMLFQFSFHILTSGNSFYFILFRDEIKNWRNFAATRLTMYDYDSRQGGVSFELK